MKRFQLTSSLFQGSVLFGYNDEGWLTFLKNDAEFTDKQHAWLFSEGRFPARIELVAALVSKIRGTLSELAPDISFDAFWELYDKKINRKRTEPLYKKLPEEEMLKAINAVKPYQKYCQRINRGIADPEKYIRYAYYETDWTKQR